jgi:hypothetical protein
MEVPNIAAYSGGFLQIHTDMCQEVLDEAVLHDLECLAAGMQVQHAHLLYTQPEQERMHTLLHIAGKEVAI